MKVIKRHIPAIIFILYLMFIYFQHQFVFMYFDDYGYASLSYGAIVGNGGTNYNLNDIIKYLFWHYVNWGGRIVPFFLEINIIKMRAWIYSYSSIFDYMGNRSMHLLFN